MVNEKIREKVDELSAMVKEHKGALICFVDPTGDGEEVLLHSEGFMRNLAILVGTAVMSNEDCRKYILKGVDAAMAVTKRKEERDAKASC